MIKQLTDTLNFQAQALVLRSERQRVLASNIANADTPGYKSRDMDFVRALRDATGNMNAANTLTTTQSGHLTAPAGARSDTQLLYGAPSQTNLDNNSVDMDRERASFAENSLKYEATLRFINSDVRMTLDSIKPYTAA